MSAPGTQPSSQHRDFQMIHRRVGSTFAEGPGHEMRIWRKADHGSTLALTSDIAGRAPCSCHKQPRAEPDVPGRLSRVIGIGAMAIARQHIQPHGGRTRLQRLR